MFDVIHVIVKGRVQGVGFRHYTLQAAHRLGVAGWVRNLPSGEVEVMARLPAGARGRFLAALQQGPPLSHVTGLDVQPAPDAEGVPTAGFRVRH